MHRLTKFLAVTRSRHFAWAIFIISDSSTRFSKLINIISFYSPCILLELMLLIAHKCFHIDVFARRTLLYLDVKDK